jgi:ABC-type transport system substrate-binding protein
MKGTSPKVAGINQVDEYNVSIRLVSPFAPFMSLLTMPACYILPQSSSAAIKDRSFFEKPFGTGPFKIVDRVRDSYIRLQANNSYVGAARPQLAEIELRIIPENMKAAISICYSFIPQIINVLELILIIRPECMMFRP